MFSWSVQYSELCNTVTRTECISTELCNTVIRTECISTWIDVQQQETSLRHKVLFQKNCYTNAMCHCYTEHACFFFTVCLSFYDYCHPPSLTAQRLSLAHSPVSVTIMADGPSHSGGRASIFKIYYSLYFGGFFLQGLILQCPVVTICTASLTFTILSSAHTAVFMCFVLISEQTEIISL
jgi:hypothetical protein